MRVEAIRLGNVYRANSSRKNYGQNIKNNYVTQSDTVSFKPRLAMLTFTGIDRNVNQIASFAYENNGTGLAEDAQGGLGVVTYEAPKSFNEHEGLDVRSFMPAHEHNNSKGGYKFLLTKDIKLENGKLPEEIEARWFLSAAPGQSREEFAKALGCNAEDLRYVIQGEPNGKTATSLSKYCLIEPTSVKGEIERMSDMRLGEIQKVPFEIFKIADDNPSYNKLKGKPNYVIWTQELAKTPRPYTYSANGHGGIEAEIINSDYCRAYLQAEKMMNTEEFGYWKPANYWGHDRPIATFFSHIASLSADGDDYYNGTRAHYTAHNTGVNYQGHTNNPFQFARLIFNAEDVKALKNLPEYELLEWYNSRGWDNLAKEEQAFVHKLFEPIIGKFRDFSGNYNVTKVAIVATKMNSENITFGTVSPNFDKEMKNPNMDVAPNIGGDLREIETISPLNGSTPASLGIDKVPTQFGRGSNTLTELREGFTPIKYNGNNIEEIVANRIKNAKWLTGILEDAEKEGQQALNKVFFHDKQIEEGRSVLGSLSRFKDDEMLIMGWGRSDEQKGYPILYKGFLKFLKRDDVPKELKLKVKLLNGAGDAPWDKEAKDFKIIKETLKEIEELDGGIYKHNAMYVDGRFPNTLVACATHGAFTSRREMCGITPLEAKAAGVPYLTTKTGGPVDYTNKSNGWLTRTAPEMNPQFDGLDWNTPKDIVEAKRVERASDEVSDCFKEMVEEYAHNRTQYIEKCKKNIEEEFDWHNNKEFNCGKSANKMYKENIWQIDKGWDARSQKPLKRLVGKMLNPMEAIQKTLEDLDGTLNSMCKKMEKRAGELVKEMEETMTKTAAEAAEKAQETLKTVSSEIIAKTEKTVKEITQNSVDEINNTIKTTVTTAIEKNKNNIIEGAKQSKTGKILAFGGGIAAAAIGGGAWYLAKGKELIAKGKNVQ